MSLSKPIYQNRSKNIPTLGPQNLKEKILPISFHFRDTNFLIQMKERNKERKEDDVPSPEMYHSAPNTRLKKILCQL